MDRRTLCKLIKYGTLRMIVNIISMYVNTKAKHKLGLQNIFYEKG